jgi:hypothetical protein
MTRAVRLAAVLAAASPGLKASQLCADASATEPYSCQLFDV